MFITTDVENIKKATGPFDSFLEEGGGRGLVNYFTARLIFGTKKIGIIQYVLAAF